MIIDHTKVGGAPHNIIIIPIPQNRLNFLFELRARLRVIFSMSSNLSYHYLVQSNKTHGSLVYLLVVAIGVPSTYYSLLSVMDVYFYVMICVSNVYYVKPLVFINTILVVL